MTAQYINCLTVTGSLEFSSTMTTVPTDSSLGSLNNSYEQDKITGYDSDFYMQNYFEYEQGRSEPFVRGRLKSAIDFWNFIDANPEVLQVISSGYKLPFLSTPLR